MNGFVSLLIFFPLIAGLLGFFIKAKNIRTYGLFVSFIEFILSLMLWFNFKLNPSFQFIEHFYIIKALGISYFVGVDGISLFLVILSTFITFISLVALNIQENIKNLIISVLFLEMTMVGVFLSLDVVLFYVFWELSLLPMLYIIGAWGSGERIYAATKFFLYTFFGSVFLLVGIIFIGYFHFSVTGVWSFALTDWYNLNLPINLQYWLFFAFLISFAIKTPMFPFHTWLPYAHGQAPTIGSVILAAVLLKMGTYGLVRFLLPLFPHASYSFTIPLAVIAIIMIIYAAMVAFAQEDMKQVIAYSSISHMGVIVLGVFALNIEGITGSVFFMLSHGIVSGALFLLVGVIYDRRHTKLISEFGGLANVMPKYALIYAIVLMGSVGLPLTSGFIGEFLSLLGFFKVNWMLTLLGGTGIIFGAVYMLNLYRNSFFGKVTKEENKNLKDLNTQELFALIPITLLIIALGVYPKPILEPINLSVSKLVTNIHYKLNSNQFSKKLNSSVLLKDN